MTRRREIPTASYGILMQNRDRSDLDQAVEQIQMLGYAVIDSGLSDEQLAQVREDFDAAHATYIESHGETRLREIDELNTIRCPMALGYQSFIDLAFNARLLAIIDALILGTYTLNQQNGVINPPGQDYNQGAWHRDLAYQHFTTSRPVAINALFCVDPFTSENGATFILPASHKSEAFPSPGYVDANAMQIEAPAGSFILLDCMTFHAGGKNQTNLPRRAVNHIYNMPHFRQQICIPKQLDSRALSDKQRQILGFGLEEADSVVAYLETRRSRL